MALATLIKAHKFDVVQILHDGKWLDYATVKDESDVEGIARLPYKRGEFRLQHYSDRSVVAIVKGQCYDFVDYEG